MSEPLVVVGLLSGGKDSCYNLCHCAKLGHKIAALATLAPPQGKDELDLYMYQTVGHDAVHLIYRTTITGQAINQTSTYGQRLASTSSHTLDKSDETEDLFTLLSMVKAAQPEVNAVSVGAILSNYQRVRVEHVALRAGMQLLPLSFLWQRDQAELFDEMCRAGMNSILIKVAGAGLEKVDLGKNLAKMRAKLHKLHGIYGAHICGKGGEYETFTLDCPLFKRKIVLDKTTTVVHSDSSFASVFYLQIDVAHIEEKDEGFSTLEDVAIPSLLDSWSEATLTHCSSEAQEGQERRMAPLAHASKGGIGITRRGHWCAIGSIASTPSDSIREEFKEAFDSLVVALAKESLSPAHLTHLNVYLSSQTHFADLNEVYRDYFGVDPPSRACVAINVDEQSSHHVVLDAVAFDDGVRYEDYRAVPSVAPRPRKVLHVQGRSYWAAANIGPYSQSVTANSRITIAGQIGLLPTTLQLASPIPLQIVLALQHARRVFKATLEGRAEKHQGWIEGCICWVDDVRWLSVARSAWHAQGEDLGEDTWEAGWVGSELSIEDVPIAFIVPAKGALPRSAAVEWQLFAHDGKATIPQSEDDDDDDQDSDASSPKILREEPTVLADFAGSLSLTSSAKGASSLGISHLKRANTSTNDDAFTPISPLLSSALSVKVLYSQQEEVKRFQASCADTVPAATTFLPVCGCYDPHLQPVDITLIWQSV